MSTPRGLTLAGVEIGPTGVYELDQGRRFHFVPKTRIRSISVGHGFLSERAPVMLVVGAFLIAGGLFFVPGLGMTMGGPMRGATGFIGVTFALLSFGVLLVLRSVRRGTYLRLRTDRGEERIAAGDVDPAELHTLAQQAVQYGYAYEPDA
jgi:hypothetical protein